VLNPLLIALLVFLGVAALVGGVFLLLHTKPSSKIEDRLDVLTGVSAPATKEGQSKESSILNEPLDEKPGIIQTFVERFGNMSLLFAQADTNLTFAKLTAISLVLAVVGAGLGIVVGIHPVLMPLTGILFGGMPLMWLLFRRKRRLRAFGAQLPDALEMLARSLRSGQSIGFGFNMVASEMPLPIGKEFGRVFEEQNLGIPLDESLRTLTDRIPNLDLKFFVTAVILQRQTGGDLAEILDKIGELVRDRFRIWGQIQALTGEGRLSGVVLLALPFVLFVAVYQLNPDYVKVLFVDPMGTKMLVVAVIMQVVGALVIRKIVNIKV
jgi:tight adherence protein B